MEAVQADGLRASIRLPDANHGTAPHLACRDGVAVGRRDGDGCEIVVVAAVVIALEFSVLISYVLDVVTGVMICCVSDIGVDVLTDMNIIFLTAPAEEGAIPSC